MTSTMSSRSNKKTGMQQIWDEWHKFFHTNVSRTGGRKWTKGRVFNIENEDLLMTFTNLPELSYLNLEEFTVAYNKKFPQEFEMDELLIEQRMQELEMIDFRYFNLKDIHEESLKDIYKHHVRTVWRCLSSGTLYAASDYLLRKWNVDKFRRFVSIIKKTLWMKDVLEFSLMYASQILVEFCDDSDFILDFFWEMCSLRAHKDIVKKVRTPFLSFFVAHMAIKFREDIDDEKWPKLHSELVKAACEIGEHRKLRLLLSYGWQMFFRLGNLAVEDEEFFQTLETLREICDSSEAYMRRTKTGTSFINFLFILAFILICLLHCEATDQNLTNCLRVFWRTVSSPFASIEDILYFVDLLQLYVELEPEFSVLWEAKREILLERYPKDCLEEYKPRKLMHLCRCKIRENVEMAVDLFTLPLPYNIISYLHLEW